MLRAAILFFVLTISRFSLFSQVSSEQVYKFNRVMDLISMFYVDTVQESKLVEKAIISVLKDLDPHSVYINKDEADELNEPLVGSFEGIGISYNLFHDTVYIVSTHPGGPSQRSGIKAGDRLVSIENENIAGIGINTEGVKLRLEGKKGSTVNLGVKRNGYGNLLQFSITRETIPIPSIEAVYKVNHKTGYIRLNKFSATTLDEFNLAGKKLKKEGVENIILDLRDNGGGYLKTAIDLADQFLDEKRLIVYTQGISSPKTEYFSSTKGLFKDCRLVVLIDEGTASASEIFSGAIQDWDEGIIIGRRSFGKGLVQRPFHLMDGSMIRLTIARYYTPTGRLIQKPYKVGLEKYNSDISERFKRGELFTSDSIHFPDSLKFKTLTSKRIVYGGGGIMPDIFIPYDTVSFPVFYQKMIKNGKMSEFIIGYIDANREFITSEFESFKEFNEKFVIDNEVLQSLLKFSLIDNIQDKLSKEDLLAIKSDNAFEFNSSISILNLDNPKLKNNLKALIARDIFGEDAYFEVMNNTDDAFLKAVDVISDAKEYSSLLLTK
ncbi:MAG: S41 family peptidase [Bacteroidales bacterium]